MSGAARELALRLQFEGETINGHVVTEDGVRRAFMGWLGLLSLLEALGNAPNPDTGVSMRDADDIRRSVRASPASMEPRFP